MPESFAFDVGSHGAVTAQLYRAADPAGATLILAHGAGASQAHPFMIGMAERIAARRVDVVTFNFLYTEAGRKMPDRVELLEACWRAAIASVRARGGLGNERLFIGGKSMGGRIAAKVAAAGGGLVISGLVLLGYPLHPAGKPRVLRREVQEVRIPTLIVQGTRDPLGSAAEMQRFVAKLPRMRVHAVEDGDHSLALPKRDGEMKQARALDSAASAVAVFIRGRRR